MSKSKIFTNKYTISALILLLCMAVDIFLHKGMSRVMLPASFTNKIQPYGIQPAKQPLVIYQKKWLKAVNSTSLMLNLDSATAGLELDLYLDTLKNTFFVYHDSSNVSDESLEKLLSIYKQRNLKSSLWFDLKNLSYHNCRQALHVIDRLNDSFSIKGKTILETSDAACLTPLYKDGYYTSFYVPFFNPYELKETDFVNIMDSIANVLRKNSACAVSGYYFQYPALKKFFPNYPILTWSDISYSSIVSYTFNRSLQNDTLVKVILYNH